MSSIINQEGEEVTSTLADFRVIIPSSDALISVREHQVFEPEELAADNEAEIREETNSEISGFQESEQLAVAPLLQRLHAMGYLEKTTVKPSPTLVLREYQKELAEDALAGRNVIIFAPTGSGKTVVASHIVKEHFDRLRAGTPRVAFLVPTQDLTQQQLDLFKKFGNNLRYTALSGTQQIALKHQLKLYDVFFMTPDILLNSLAQTLPYDTVSLTDDFSMIVFDECHHCMSNYTYNKLMQRHYMTMLQDDTQRLKLPQIIGLTASPGTDQAKDVEGAVQHIMQLCANLDAHRLSSIQLSKFDQNGPVSHVLVCRSDSAESDDFTSLLDSFIQVMETALTEKVEFALGMLASEKDRLSKLQPPPRKVRGMAQYETFIGSARQCASSIQDVVTRNELTFIVDMLDLLNTALLVRSVARSIDAFSYLRDKLQKFKKRTLNPVQMHLLNDSEELLLLLLKPAEKEQSLLKSALPDWPPFQPERDEQSSAFITCEMSKLMRLRYEICRQFTWKDNFLDSTTENAANSRVLVFVKQRIFGKALMGFFKEDEFLKQLNVGFLTGCNTSGSDKIAPNQRDHLLQHFREGIHKVIIATSVAEEGVDISACNLVIRYCYVTNEIGKLQASGRARAKDAQEILIIDDKTMCLAEKEQTNKMRIEFMSQAIDQVVSLIKDKEEDYKSEIRKLQKEECDRIALEQVGKQSAEKVSTVHTSNADVDNVYDVLCRNCSEILCSSESIRTKNNRYLVLDVLILDKVSSERRSLLPNSKQKCKKCSEEILEIVIISGNQFPSPLIKRISFRRGRNEELSELISPRTWNSAPIKNFTEARNEELMEYVKKLAKL